ncbi:MAG: hypothetical protein H0W15_10470 [Gemmatimonadales bacterium]|nr:hypothetical protein [Gemmatimonadales bacterium]
MGLLKRAARLLVRIAGWLVTPIVATVTAAIGAALASIFAPTVSPMTGVGIATAGGLAGAIIGLAVWIRVLRGSPQLQEALAMTPDGAPRPEAIDELIAGESRPTPPPAAP